MSRQTVTDVKQVVILRDGACEINRVRVDVDSIVARAESLSGGDDPIPKLAQLVAAALATPECRVSRRALEKLERDCAQALARDRWPEELIVEGESTSREDRTPGPGRSGAGRAR